jgi:hypothetical protein
MELVGRLTIFTTVWSALRSRLRGRPRSVWTAVIATVTALAVAFGVVACGEVRSTALPDHVGASTVPSATATGDAGAALSVLPGTQTPSTGPGGGSGDSGDGTGGGGTGGGSGGGGGGEDDPGGGSGHTELGGTVITSKTFGMHVGGLHESLWPSVSVGSYRIWNEDSTWGAVEPSNGVWDFAALDERVNQAQADGASVVVVLGMPPAWAASRADLYTFGGSPSPPKNMADWTDYVATVATRYAGRVEGYEIWNEPNLDQFFTGTPQQLGALTRAAGEVIHRVAPGTKVVSAGFSARTGLSIPYFREFVETGLVGAVDVVGIHIYPYIGDGPESLIATARTYRSIARQNGLGELPMWNTEIGYGRTPDLIIDDPAMAASLILRTFLVLPGAGMQRNYWYAWDNRTWVGLYLVAADRRTPTDAAYRYQEAEQWLVNSYLLGCKQDLELWTCRMRYPEGPTATIAWRTSGTSTIPAPPGSQVVYTFGGGERSVTGGASVTVGLVPVMIATGSLSRLG